ncbi:hypothetical protein M621_00845 [Serratia plymuthica S13]|uniref:Uncharacterized protein n=1 Tax=Serratia plymuthica S13 TaxID=1348660 RepID=S4YV11_SERPL|nr:hypothetical protein M621_00845 [Serratia plymuthica S13]
MIDIALTLHPGVNSRVKRRMRIIVNCKAEGKSALPVSVNRWGDAGVIRQKKKMLFPQGLKRPAS